MKLYIFHLMGEVLKPRGNFNFSTDYKALFDLIQQAEIVCYVDYEMTFQSTGERHAARDIARIRRLKPFEIRIRVRGVQYGSVDPFHEWIKSEEELFINECVRMNLEFIVLQTDQIM